MSVFFSTIVKYFSEHAVAVFFSIMLKMILMSDETKKHIEKNDDDDDGIEDDSV